MITDLPDQYKQGNNPVDNCDFDITVSPADTVGIVWTIRVSAADNQWVSVCYGNSLFVAVANTGVGNRVMTSPDGIVWTIRVSAADNQWMGVCYGNGLFVAIARTGVGNRVMTSPDGIVWTIRVSAADNEWYSVCYGNGDFVAVSATGAGNRVMTSKCKTLLISLPIGILRRVMINFPDGCNNRIRVNVLHGSVQIIPIDVGGLGKTYHAFNDYTFDFDTFLVIYPGATSFTIGGWNDSNTGIDWSHVISFTFFVERVAVP